MVYALFMATVLLVLWALHRRHLMAIPLFLVTLAVIAVFLVTDMTSPLTLSF